MQLPSDNQWAFLRTLQEHAGLPFRKGIRSTNRGRPFYSCGAWGMDFALPARRN